MTATPTVDLSTDRSVACRPTPVGSRRTVVALPPVDLSAARRWRAVGWGLWLVLSVVLAVAVDLQRNRAMPLSALALSAVGLAVFGGVGYWCMAKARDLSTDSPKGVD